MPRLTVDVAARDLAPGDRVPGGRTVLEVEMLGELTRIAWGLRVNGGYVRESEQFVTSDRIFRVKTLEG